MAVIYRIVVCNTLFHMFYILSGSPSVFSASRCPPVCVCTSDLKTVDCSNRALLQVPSNMPTEVNTLLLNNNPIILTNQSLTSLRSLLELDLRYCMLTWLPPGVFSDLVSLKVLRLDGNQFENSRLEAIVSEFKDIDELYLSGNLLTEIPSIGIKTLKDLKLDSNRISNATFPRSFTNCLNLRAIHLSNNRISELAPSAFESVTSRMLYKVNLDNNIIEKIDPTAFSPLSNRVMSLNLDGNAVLSTVSLQDALGAFAGSQKLASLSLRSMGIVNVTSSLFTKLGGSGLTALHISKNPINFVDPSAFASLVQLQFLFLSECRLSDENIPLDLLPNLQEIWLDGNNFTKIPTRLPPSLIGLHIQDNRIGQLTQRQFNKLPLLAHLDLSDNRIANIPAGAFTGLTRLTHLNLRENSIQQLLAGASLDLISLQVLDLSTQHPPLNSIQPDSLILPMLRTINVKNNNLKAVFTNKSASPFVELRRLQVLDLGNNQIFGFYNASLTGLADLRFLLASHNNIAFWENDSFSVFHKTLITLDLSSNRISSIQKLGQSNNLEATVSGLNFQNLNLSDNPFNCSCPDLAWFVTWALTTRKVTVTDFKEYACASPPLWASRDLREFDPAVECRAMAVKGQLAALAAPSSNVNHSAKHFSSVTKPNDPGISGGAATLATVGFLCIAVLSAGAVFWLRAHPNMCSSRRSLYQPLDSVHF